MAELRPKDLYGSGGSVPETFSEGGAGGERFRQSADASDFGSDIGRAMQQQGAEVQKQGQIQLALATKAAQEAIETKFNDDYAKIYAPRAAELRGQFDQLQGQDKIHGHEAYLRGLQDLNNQFASDNNRSQMERELWSNTGNKRLVQETDYAGRELSQVQSTLAVDALANRIMANNDYAAMNYNNPQIVDDIDETNDAALTLKYIDQGADINSPEVQTALDDERRASRASMADGMIKAALARGDAMAANTIRARYGNNMPGYQQLAIDHTLHTENLRQTGKNTLDAMMGGSPLPQPVGAPAAQVQAVVADTAQDHGVDPNHALTVAWIESSMGQNVGKRGDIGQTGKPGDLPTQAVNMVTELKKSQQVAAAALGRAPQPWETYACYQQGAGGGPALLKAAMNDPEMRAVDALAPLYKNRSIALQAVTHNGGNAAMTAGDFLGMIKKKYQFNEKRAMCEIPPATSAAVPDPVTGPQVETFGPPAKLSEAILRPYEKPTQAVQPAATPRGTLNNFNERLPDMLARAQAIPNVEMRNAVIDRIYKQRAVVASAAEAYSNVLVNKAQQIAAADDFTSMDQIPAEMQSALMTEHPETINYLERAAERNLEKASGGAGKNIKTYGPSMFRLMREINTGTIKSPVELMRYLPDGKNPGELTLAGYDRLMKEFDNTPEKSADTAMKTQAFKTIRQQITGANPELNINDPKGEELWSRALPKLFQSIDEGQAKGLSMGELTNPDSPHWIGKSVQSLRRSPTQTAIDLQVAEDGGGAAAMAAAKTGFAALYNDWKTATPESRAVIQEKMAAMKPYELFDAYRAAQSAEEKAQLKALAADLGFVRRENPIQPPIAQ